jgi:glycosyltransferase involved in cell wall biosynthesis
MILYVARYHPALSETFVRDEVRALHEAGVPVALAAFDARDAVATEPIGAPLHLQPHRWGWLPALPALVAEWLRAPGRVPWRVLWLTTLVRRARRVHVHFAGEAAEWVRAACLRAGVPYSVTVHAVDLYKPRAALPEVLRGAAAVVAMTAFNQRWVAERHGVRARLVRFGLDLDGVPRANPAGSRRVVAVGRNVPKKGLDLVVALAGRLGAAAEVRLVSDVREGGAATVLGLLPHAEVLRELGGAGLFVLPCRRAPDGDMDGLPVAVVEALAAGLPVVTTAVSGLPELVDEAVGWVVPPDDLPALEAAVREALANPAERARRGAAGRARVHAQGYTRARLVAEMIEVLGG